MSLEMVMQVWHDESGSRIEVGMDPDGLGLVEIRFFLDDGMRGSVISISHEKVPELIEALTRVADYHDRKQAK